MKIELLIAKVPAFGSPARGESDCLAIFEAREPVCVLMKIEWLVTDVTGFRDSSSKHPGF